MGDVIVTALSGNVDDDDGDAGTVDCVCGFDCGGEDCGGAISETDGGGEEEEEDTTPVTFTCANCFKLGSLLSQVSYLMSSYHLPNRLSKYSDTAAFCSSICS